MSVVQVSGPKARHVVMRKSVPKTHLICDRCGGKNKLGGLFFYWVPASESRHRPGAGRATRLFCSIECWRKGG